MSSAVASGCARATESIADRVSTPKVVLTAGNRPPTMAEFSMYWKTQRGSSDGVSDGTGQV